MPRKVQRYRQRPHSRPSWGAPSFRRHPLEDHTPSLTLAFQLVIVTVPGQRAERE